MEGLQDGSELPPHSPSEKVLAKSANSLKFKVQFTSYCLHFGDRQVLCLTLFLKTRSSILPPLRELDCRRASASPVSFERFISNCVANRAFPSWGSPTTWISNCAVCNCRSPSNGDIHKNVRLCKILRKACGNAELRCICGKSPAAILICFESFLNCYFD